jgi:type I restriction enzyme S subunit
MNTEYPETELGAIATLWDCLHKTPSYSEDGYPMVRVTDIKRGSLDLSGTLKVQNKTYQEFIRRYKPKAGDILLSRVGSYGNTCYVNRDQDFCLGQNTVCIASDQERIIPYFLYCCFNAPSVKHQMDSFVGGSSQPTISLKNISLLRIPTPNIAGQRKIATILSAYDDLIENNLRRIKILEEMAQNIYREWFVKFRFPGHQHARFTDSALGRIPEGWLGLFPDFVDFKEGPGLRKWQYRSEGLPFLNIRTLVDNDINLSKVQYLDPKEVEAKYQHFLLKEYDHVVSSSGTLGRIVTIQKQHLPLMLNTSIIRMRPSTIRVGRWQLKHFLNSDYFQHQILSFAIGAAQPNFGPSHLQQMLIVTPSDEIGILYEETVEPLEEMIGTMVRKNTTLRRTRDLLLPRLISGEVDVSELDINTHEEAIA